MLNIFLEHHFIENDTHSLNMEVAGGDGIMSLIETITKVEIALVKDSTGNSWDLNIPQERKVQY